MNTVATCGAVQKSYLGGSFGSLVDKKNEEGIM